MPVLDPVVLLPMLKFWTKTYLPNKIRDFVFKLFHNLLGINPRISHFVQGASRNCTFCALTRKPLVDETMEHLYYNCPLQLSGQPVIYLCYILIWYLTMIMTIEKIFVLRTFTQGESV